LAFIRKKTVDGKEYAQVVENYREGDKVRQRVLLHLGRYSPAEALILWTGFASNHKNREGPRQRWAAKSETLRALITQGKVSITDEDRNQMVASRAAAQGFIRSHPLNREDVVGRVVHVKAGEPYDVYIGRHTRGGYKKSIWHNPYNLPKNATPEERDAAIARFEFYLLEERPDLVARLGELRGKVLGCWCAPKPCHGEVLASLAAAS
jgi:hypothetical protein